jgi:hypothetical protein
VSSSFKSDWLQAPSVVLLALTISMAATGGAAAQSIEIHQWQGTNASTRQPEQVIAATTAEWHSLWSRVGMEPPQPFDQGHTEAVGIFLGGRGSDGYSVNILSAARRRDRIIVVFEERAPDSVMAAQAAPAARIVSNSPTAMPGTASFAATGATASLPPIPYRPPGPPSSPWAILLLGRADLPVTVEQRLFFH